jgi:hypothetical protein
LPETDIHEMDTWASPENMISLKLVASQGSQSRVGPPDQGKNHGVQGLMWLKGFLLGLLRGVV